LTRFLRFTALLVASLGDGFNITLQAYLTGVVDASNVAQMCSWMAMIGTVGTIVGRPIIMLAYHYVPTMPWSHVQSLPPMQLSPAKPVTQSSQLLNCDSRGYGTEQAQISGCKQAAVSR
jgi:hypothetical protein